MRSLWDETKVSLHPMSAPSASSFTSCYALRFAGLSSWTSAASHLTGYGVGCFDGERSHGDCAVAAGGRWHGATAWDK
jgi:hypothetical protein